MIKQNSIRNKDRFLKKSENNEVLKWWDEIIFKKKINEELILVKDLTYLNQNWADNFELKYLWQYEEYKNKI